MSKTFVTHHRSQDISDLGEVVKMLEGVINPFDITALAREMKEGMTDYVIRRDRIAPVGNVSANFVAGVLVGLLKPDKVKMSIYSASERKYRDCVLDLRALKKEAGK